MALKDRTRRTSYFPYEGTGVGILKGFSVDTPATLNPAITTGDLLLPGGHVVNLIDGDFAFIGPAGDGLIAASDITSCFFSPSSYFAATATAVPTANSGAIYSNLTGTKVTPNDIRLFTATSDATTITKIVPGDWYDPRVLHVGSCNVGGTGNLRSVVFPGINGRAAYCYGMYAVTTTTIANDTATIDLEQINPTTAVESSLGTLVVTVKTLDLDSLDNIDYSEWTTYVVVQPGTQLVLECTEAAQSGVVEVYGLFGGYPDDLYR